MGAFIKHRLVVLISGSGSNLQAIIDRIQDGSINAEIAAVISNVDGVKGLQRATQSRIDTAVLKHSDFVSREDFDKNLIELIDNYQPNTVLLAGFMRILTPTFVSHYAGRLLNIHPSLLPKFQGLDTHRRALDANDSHHGCSVHFVTQELDGGPIIAQAAVRVELDDTPELLARRVLEKEHVLYPMVVSWVVDGRIKLVGTSVSLDGRKLDAQGYRLKAD